MTGIAKYKNAFYRLIPRSPCTVSSYSKATLTIENIDKIEYMEKIDNIEPLAKISKKIEITTFVAYVC